MLFRETKRAVTPMGGLSVLAVFLKKVGWAEQLQQCLPIQWKSPNAIEAGETLTAFMVAVAAGARRFAHVGWLRADRAVQALLTFLEQRQLLYIVVVRMTPWLKREATHVQEWRPMTSACRSFMPPKPPSAPF